MMPKYIIIDLFCGAGGTTTGFSKVPGFEVVACVNHDANAIKSHEANHPDCEHYTEDITCLYGVLRNGMLFKTAKMVHLLRLVDLYRAFYPGINVILWASLECTNFSKAKGGMARDADSRTLADHIDRYIIPMSPDYVKIENVVEFMSWGPLCEKGKPMSRRNGIDYMRWCNHIDSLGYRNEWKQLNAADFGAYQSRNRLFGVFAKDGLPIVWPEVTHAKVKGRKSKVASKKVEQPNLFALPSKKLAPWKPVREVLDMLDEGVSIFDRKKPLVDASLERIYAGLVEFVAGGKDAFMVKYNSMNQSGKYVAPSVEEPSPTVSTQNRLYVAFIAKHYSGRPAGKVIPVDGPAGTVTTVAGQSKVHATFLHSYYGNGSAHDIAEPSPTLSTHDRFAKVDAYMVNSYSGGGVTSSLDTVAGALTTNPKGNLVQAFLMPTNYDNKPASLDEPCKTLLASRKHHYIVNPQWGGNGGDVDKPAFTIIARQDKSPLYLVCVDEVGSEQHIAIRLDEGDSEIMVKIKEFMAMYNIVDIKMRMLKIPELLRIQGFPDNYKLMGNQSEQKKYIGNAVHPLVPEAMAKALLNELQLAA